VSDTTGHDLAARWEEMERGDLTEVAPPPSSTPLFYRPLSNSVDDFVRWVQTPADRIYLGFNDLDEQMRGIAPGEMLLINGYSHSGKTLFLMEILRANRDKPVMYFCPDEPRTLTLIKLVSLMTGTPGRVLEQLIEQDDRETIDLIEQTAQEHFGNLAVFDQFLGMGDMDRAVNETAELIGGCSAIVYDYLELLPTEDNVAAKANTIKAFARRHDVPLIVLHQTSRSAGAQGRKMTISSGSYGGEQQASHIVGVRRKKFGLLSEITEIEERAAHGSVSEVTLERLDMLRAELAYHESTITLNLVKCKRHDATLVDDIDYYIEQGTGRLKSFRPPTPAPQQPAEPIVEWEEPQLDGAW
jgi:KaiC/GvpD/RAD55 family RecA-like ATPase